MEVYSNPQTGPLPGPPGSYLSRLSAHKFIPIKKISSLFQHTSTVECRSCLVYAQDNNSLPVWSIFCHQLTNPYLHQFSTISGGNCIRLTVSSFYSQANQSNQSSIQRELLMPSPQVIDLTLPDDKIQPDPIRSDQATSTPTQATNRFKTVPQHPPYPASTELGEFFQSFKVLLQPSNELKIFSHSNLSSTTLTLDKHSSTASTTNTGLVYLTSTLWRPASTHTLKTVLSQKSL